MNYFRGCIVINIRSLLGVRHISDEAKSTNLLPAEITSNNANYSWNCLNLTMLGATSVAQTYKTICKCRHYVMWQTDHQSMLMYSRVEAFYHHWLLRYPQNWAGAQVSGYINLIQASMVKADTLEQVWPLTTGDINWNRRSLEQIGEWTPILS